MGWQGETSQLSNVAADVGDDEWTAHMLRGDFAAAWSVSDRVLREQRPEHSWHLPRHLQHVWNGTSLEGRRVLVRCYHGLGDTLHFIRYAPLVKAIAARLSVWAQPSLLPLLSTVEGIDHLLPLHDGVPEAEFNVDVELMELPHVFRTTLDTVPHDVPYLRVPPLARTSREFSVGIAWGAGDWDERRSVPFELLAPLGDIPGISLHVLQRGAHREEWRAGFGTLATVRDSYEEARLMRSLDLVITVDSMPAHLAGALGVPVWVMLHHAPDWRWMREGERSPWYPTMRLFRQSQPGEWEPVIARVASELARAAASASPYSHAGTIDNSLHRAS